MDGLPLDDIEELALCSCCQRTFDDGERVPKILDCKHHFCLACTSSVLGGGREARCVHCWKRTELPGGRASALPTHAAVLALALRLAPTASWCCACGTRARLTCELAHAPHMRPPHEALALLRRDARLLAADLTRLATRRRDLLLRALEAATALKLRLEGELAAPPPEPAPLACATPEAATGERDRLRTLHADALLQARLDDLVRSATVPVDLEPLRRAPVGLCDADSPALERRDPLLLLANYCTAQLYVRCRARQRVDCADVASDASPEPCSEPPELSSGSPPRPLSPYPLFYFELEVNCAPFGRVVVEVRDDAAPRMARNFAMLTTGELGVGYRGCAVFQCWENESIITGDFEQNNGRGGRSVFEESFFMPDDTKMAAVRGSVGMRRSQKRHDHLGLVGSQFRIMLREMRGFTAIFAFVVEGLELVDRLSRTGDSAGKPHSSIVIVNCGRLN